MTSSPAQTSLYVFDRAGARDAVLAVADSPAALFMFDALDGKELVRIPTGTSFRARFKGPSIIIPRVDLRSVLLDPYRRSAGVELMPDAMVQSLEDRGVGVAATTADDRTFAGAALVAAGGVHSLFRDALVGDGEPRPIGYVALRTVVPISEIKADVPRDCVVLWSGPSFHVVHYPPRHGKEFNIVAVFRTSTYAQRGEAASYRAGLEDTDRYARPSMRALIALMVLRWPRSIGDRDPVRQWQKGRVVLLGDAAHAPPQSRAQGSSRAIVDGLCLGESIAAADGGFAVAFQRFETARLLRTARVHLESRALWQLYHAEGIARDVRNSTVAGWDEAYQFNCLSWLYRGAQAPM